MDAMQVIRRSLAHSAWADTKLFAALRDNPQLTAAWREYTHVLGAAEVWLARLERRPASVAVWPVLSLEQADALREAVAKGYERFTSRLESGALTDVVEYTNSAGQTFHTAIGDILLHVALHGQYHRGKINLLLRQNATEPAPADYISFVRGVPAAVTPVPELPHAKARE